MRFAICLRRWVTLSIILCMAVATSGCGDDNPSGTQSDRDGLLMILIHDAPVDSLKEVWLSVHSVELIGADADSTVQPTLLDTVRIDLKSLDSLTAVLAVAAVPSGTYSKIRLWVSDPEFVTDDGTVISKDDIKLVANGKVDINFQGPFFLEADSTSVISLDFDLDSSIQINLTGNGKYILRPQILVDAENVTSNNIVINGAVVSSVDSIAGELMVTPHGSSVSLTVKISSATIIEAGDGTAMTIGDIAVNDVVNVHGTLDASEGCLIAEDIVVNP